MIQANDILLRLLRSGMGMAGQDIPSDFKDWKELIYMTFAHGVAALTVDGYLAMQGEKSLLETDEHLEDYKYQWFGSVLQAEGDFKKQLHLAEKMADLFASEGIKTYVLKGLSLARLYPEPSHRTCCDCDIFLGEDYEKGNALIERKGLTVYRHFYKNSTFFYKGLMVENHRFCSPIRGGSWRKDYERYLQSIVDDGAVRLGNSQLWRPGPLFTALLVTSHAQTHFLVEKGITLRHVCDFALSIAEMERNGLLERYEEDCRRFGLWKFASSMAGVTERVCGVRLSFGTPGTEASERLLEAVFAATKSSAVPTSASAACYQCKKMDLASRFGIMRNILNGRWKFRLYSDRSMFETLVELVWGVLTEKTVELK